MSGSGSKRLSSESIHELEEIDYDFSNGKIENEVKVEIKKHSPWLSNSELSGIGTILTRLEDEVSNNSFEIEKENLILTSNKSLSKFNFDSEIRGQMDMKNYISEMVVLLDVYAMDIESIVQELLKHMVPHHILENVSKEVMKSIFTDESKNILSYYVQGLFKDREDSLVYDQSWICASCMLPGLKKRKLGLIRLKFPLNLGITASNVRFFILCLIPNNEKSTKNAYETSRLIGTLLSSVKFRDSLLKYENKMDIIDWFHRRSLDLANDSNKIITDSEKNTDPYCTFGKGLAENFCRRVRYYWSDIKDGLVGDKTIQKSLASIFFLYFSCLLPAIAFGALNASNTMNKIGTTRALVGQGLGGLLFALFCGQPMIVIGTTALCALYTKVIYAISLEIGVDFYVLYALTGLWNTLYVVTYSFFGLSRLIKWSTRSVEEIFAMFIMVCFVIDGLTDMAESFRMDYFSEYCANISEVVYINPYCQRDSSLLALILMIGTVWMAVNIYSFNRTPYLNTKKRELISDYALPVAIILFTLVKVFIFTEISVKEFKIEKGYTFQVAKLENVSLEVIAYSAGLGFALSILFFMDQNITSQIVNSPLNRMKKGEAPHLDLFVVALINGILSIFGLPWMHAILPQSPLHVRNMADIEERLDQGYVQESIIRVRETRLTSAISNLLIGISAVYLIPYPLGYIPVPVLDGLFLYCAIASLRGNSLFERFLLIFTEQNAYPPNHYVRRVTQRKIHLFTICEIIQLVILCVIGFFPMAYVQMSFPIMIALLIPIRYLIIPCIMKKDELNALDSY